MFVASDACSFALNRCGPDAQGACPPVTARGCVTGNGSAPPRYLVLDEESDWELAYVTRLQYILFVSTGLPPRSLFYPARTVMHHLFWAMISTISCC